MNDVVQLLARQQLHHEENEALVGLPKVVQSDEVGVAELGSEPSLAGEAFDRLGRLRDVRSHDLDRDGSLQRGLGAEEHCPHAAFAQHLLDLVAPH